MRKNNISRILYISIFLGMFCILVIGSFFVEKLSKIPLEIQENIIEVETQTSEYESLIAEINSKFAEENIVITQNLLNATFQLQSVYYGKSTMQPSLKSGSFWDNANYNSNLKVAIIGEDVEKKIKFLKNQKYIKIGDSNFKIIGVLKKQKEQKYDFRVLIPVCSYLKGIGDKNRIIIETESQQVYNEVFDMLNKYKIENNINYLHRENYDLKDKIYDIFYKSNNVMYFYTFMFIIIIVFLNTQIQYWLTCQINDMKSYLKYGLTKSKTFCLYILKLLKLCIWGILAGSIFFLIVCNGVVKSNLNIYLILIVSIVFLVLILITVNLTKCIRKIFKRNFI
ncbi:hypothetical protein DWW31_02460 [Clostridium sp. AF15-17LB]|nr:hypothetical protein DWW31_02460 [Clostridium sp. AF15-17LB]